MALNRRTYVIVVTLREVHFPMNHLNNLNEATIKIYGNVWPSGSIGQECIIQSVKYYSNAITFLSKYRVRDFVDVVPD